MASLKLFSSIFIVLFAVAASTTYTTTVTTITTTEDEGSSSQQGSRHQCQKEIQSKDLDMCKSFLSMEQGGSGRLRMIVETGEQGQEQDEQKQCCQQLKQVRSQCRCAAIEDVVKQQIKGRQSMHNPKIQKVLQKARNLPTACDWQQPQQCSFDQPSSFA
ncbi:AAI domain-containing protein [Heracleum sosnowskyi]|uniref:AAI domain-containing protein n=1 Tax=Heracleum sosnowskyi TaxID=360622 RepID=A0AAD8H470_9APIA|nr:AAI domain-containing protein [Heracleum sosnowskyi]